MREDDKDKSLLAEIAYVTHLWQKKQLQTVAKVTSYDIATVLKIAVETGVVPGLPGYRLEEANVALHELEGGVMRRATVLTVTKVDSLAA